MTKLFSPRVAALVGFMLTWPFLILYTIMSGRVEPFFSLIRPGLHSSAVEYFLLAISLLFFPIGFFITIQPMIQDRKLYILNAIFGVLIATTMLLLWDGFSTDIIECDFYHIPNCD